MSEQNKGNQQEQSRTNGVATNEHDVEVAKQQVAIEQIRHELESMREKNRYEYTRYQAEMNDKTARFKIVTDAVVGGTYGAMALTAFVMSQHYKRDIRKHEIEFDSE